MREQLSKSYESLRERYDRITEAGIDEEGVDAWAYIEGPLETLDDFVERVRENEDTIGTLELRKEKFGALIYPRGSLSSFTVGLTYLLAGILPEDAKSFSLIGYELTHDSVNISVLISTSEECISENVYEYC